MQVHVSNTRNEMGKAAGKAVEKRILKVLKKKESIRIVFAAAPSQNEFLSYLRNSKSIPWEKVSAFHMDEYIGLQPDDPALFSNFLKRNLFDHLNFKEVFLINGDKNIEQEIDRYTALIEKAPIDIVCMGIGENGHIAFNDPPIADFNDPKTLKTVELDQACRQQQVNDACFPTIEQVPTHAITLTVPALLNASFISCVVPGKYKKNALEKSLYGPIETLCPASILRIHGDCHLFTDKGAYTEPSQLHFERETIGKDLFTGNFSLLNSENKRIETQIKPLAKDSNKLPFFAPGLVDLQVNGVNGVDFNDLLLTKEDLERAVTYLLSQGVSSFFPTLITNEKSRILSLLNIIRKVCEENPLVNSCIAGIHLEGPFISSLEGARGAHNSNYIQKPDWNLVQKFQQASGGRIKLITLAPELTGAMGLIKKCHKSGINVAIGHSLASDKIIEEAVLAGANLSTHLGNAVPLMLPRHPNLLWDQLANDSLYVSLIADGFHLGESFLKVVLKTKGEKAFLVSDSTMFCGMKAGEYKSHIGEEVVLEPNGKLSLKYGNGLLAGASKNLLEGVQYLIDKNMKSPSEAWEMASIIPFTFLDISTNQDVIIFSLSELGQIFIQKVVKEGQVAFQQKT
ncbi:glucosamine-6-phosphate isomerase [Cyclobacteriaceae bacterium YHN15]|nr:glucosamine-6-phosphate isomerase [Cyclobacteriaceae bacterium YHN15]